MQKLGIYFTVTAALDPVDEVKSKFPQDEYLPSGVPLPMNLLGPFADDPALSGLRPQLSALRITKVALSTAMEPDAPQTLRSGSRYSFRAAPVLLWRIRYSRLSTSPKQTVLVASLDFEITAFAGCNVSVETVEVQITNGLAEILGGGSSAGHPAVYRPGDQFTLLCKLTPTDTYETTPIDHPRVHTMELNVHATALVSNDCTPQIVIRWKTGVDFPSPTASSLSGHIPLAPRSLIESAGMTQKSEVNTQTSFTLIAHGTPQKNILAGAFGISLTVSGPPHVYVGEVFQWNLFVINRTEKARTLAAIVIPRRRTSMRQHQSKPSLTSFASGFKEDKADRFAEAVVDDHAVYASQKSSVLEPAEVVSISTDVRIG